MKLISKLVLLFGLVVFSLLAFPSNKPVIIHDDIAYIHEQYSKTINRYSLVSGEFLSALELDRKQVTAHVDESGIYTIGMEDNSEFPIFHYDLSGNNRTILTYIQESKNQIDDLGDVLIVSGSDSFDSSHIYSIDKQTGTILDDIALHLPMHRNGELTEIGSRVAVDTYLRTVYFVTDDIYSNYSYRNSAIVDQDGRFALDLKQKHIDYFGYLYTDNSINYLVSGYGQIFNKSDLTLKTTLKDLDESEQEGYINHLVYRFLVIDQLPLSLSDRQLHLFDENGNKISSRVLIEPYQTFFPQYPVVYGGNIYVFNQKTDELSVDVYQLSDILPKPKIEVDPSTLSFTPDYSAIDKDGDVLYMFSLGQYYIFRWSLGQQKYLSPITLDEMPRAVAYSPGQHKMYIAYGRRIDALDLSTSVQQTFSDSPTGTTKLYAGDNFVLAFDNLVGTSTQAIRAIDLSGVSGKTTLIQSTEGFAFSNETNRSYLLNNTSPHWYELDQNAKRIDHQRSFEGTQGIDWSYGSISKNGDLLASSSGEIFSAYSFEPLATFGPKHSSQSKHTAWMFGNLLSFENVGPGINRSEVIRYRADFSENTTDSFSIAGLPIAILPNPSKNQIVLIASENGIPAIYSYDIQEEDFDNDGVNDASDEYPTNPNLQTFSPVKFLPTSTISKWNYSQNLTAILGDARTLSGRTVLPLEFSTGNQLFFSSQNEELTFHGYYLPKITVQDVDYAVDLVFDSPVHLNKRSDEFVGEGKAVITPDIGEQVFSYRAKVKYLYDHTISGEDEEEYYAVGFQLDIDAKALVGGLDIALQYDSDLYFAEDIGLAKIDEKGISGQTLQSIENTQPVSPPTSPSAPANPSQESSSGGGSVSYFGLLILLVISCRRNGKTEQTLLHRLYG